MRVDHTAGRATTSVEAAAKTLGIGRNQAYAAAARGELPVIRMGKRLLVPLAALSACSTGTPSRGPAEFQEARTMTEEASLTISVPEAGKRISLVAMPPMTRPLEARFRRSE